MLLELDVRDLGIIEHVQLKLPPGFLVLSGETGAGKSLLVQSLQLLAGGRADADSVRGGCERLVVTGRFERPGTPEASALLDELGVGTEDEILVRREVARGGRSRAFLDDVAVTAGALQRLAPHLLSIDGQHEQRGLADPATHIEVVDEAGGLAPLDDEVAAAFQAWRSVVQELGERRRALAGRRDRLDVIEFQTREIEELRPLPAEDEALREERTLLRHAGKIGELLGTARQALGGECGAVALARASRSVRQLCELGVAVTVLADDLEQARLLAEEAERSLLSLTDRVRSDPARLEAVEGRLAALERVARKYGGSLGAALDHAAQLCQERAALQGAEDGIAKIEADEVELAARYLDSARRLSAARREAAELFSASVVAVLARLALPGVRLGMALSWRDVSSGGLEVDGRRVEPGADGIDTGEFLISANPGEEMRSMARIASGGELSRIHLAMRAVLRDRQGSARGLTLLFDEVDTGIGGKVADELGELLAEQATRHQVLVVTHLPQVAGRATSHFVVRKETTGGRTVTQVEEATGQVRVEELVRMLGGGPDTPAARQHARELLRRTSRQDAC